MVVLLAGCTTNVPPAPEGCTVASLDVESVSAAASDDTYRSLLTMTVIGHPVGTKRPPGDGTWNRHRLTFEWYNDDVHAWEAGPYDPTLDLDAMRNLDPAQFDPLVRLNPPCEPGPGDCPVLGATSGTLWIDVLELGQRLVLRADDLKLQEYSFDGEKDVWVEDSDVWCFVDDVWEDETFPYTDSRTN